jgi:hypothetical protein
MKMMNNSKKNNILRDDLPIHNWYQFVLGYPPHLVRGYIDKFKINRADIILDPFCGTGTTNVESLKSGISNYGIEANPIPYLASCVKTKLDLNPEDLKNSLAYIIKSALLSFKKLGIKDNSSFILEVASINLPPYTLDSIPKISEEKQKLIPNGFISEKPLIKILIIKEIIDDILNIDIRDFFRIALANLIVNKAGNIGFGPEIYKTKSKEDIDAINYFFTTAWQMIQDLEKYRNSKEISQIIHGDSRYIDRCLDDQLLGRINYVITSPPYPNEKDYTRSTRLENVLLDFINTKQDLRTSKEKLLRSNSRNIFVGDKDGDNVKNFPNICELANKIELRRIELNKSSGFEKLYHKIVLHYFGGMYLHLKSLKPYLADDAKLAYVVGDQMSFFRINIPTANLLAEIAESLGYEILEIELWRTRLATATKLQLNENVLILKNG